MKPVERIFQSHVASAASHRTATTPMAAAWALALCINNRLSVVIVRQVSVLCID